MGSRSVAGMLTLLRFIVSVLVRRFRSRAVLELREPRPAPSAARSSSPAAGSTPAVRDRPLALGLALPIVAALSGGDGLGQAGNGYPVAPSGIQLVLALALEIRECVSGARDSRSDSADEPRQPAVGCASDPWRAAQARYRDRSSYGRQVHGAKTRCAFPDLAHLPTEPRRRHRGHRYFRRGVRIVSAALRYD